MDELVVRDKPLTANEIRANVNLIQEVLTKIMKKDVHYGTIPGTQKPTLYKAGSEKILSTFRIAVDLEVNDLSGDDFYRYQVKARGVIPSGDVVGCGIGECSTDEEKYKWRGVNSEAEWNATPEDRRRIKYARPKGDWDGQTKQIRTNPADLANTCLKMAKKRAQIDLTLTATAASDVFEQDIEDLPEEYRDGMKTDQKVSGKPEVAKPQPKEDKPKDAPPVEGSHITVKIETVTLKSGKKKDGKTWEKYGVKGDNGIWYGTFSKTLGEAAKILEGQPAFITYEQSGEFFTLVDIKPVAPSVAVEGEALPPEESTGIEPF